VLVDSALVSHHGGAVRAITDLLIEAPVEPIIIPGGEAAKDAAHLSTYWTALKDRGFHRRSLLVVIGGGAVTDVGAFLASTWLRGIDVVVVPTTLLSQVDAGLGGKCGVNLHGAKNQIGSVYQPLALFVDPEFLRTNHSLDVLSGLGELLKTGLLSGHDLLGRVEALGRKPLDGPSFAQLGKVLSACLRFKAAIVQEDEREEGVRTTLNLGHTVAHVLEGLAQVHGTPSLPHGQAVAAGILAEATVFGASEAVLETITNAMHALGLSQKACVPFVPEQVRTLLKADKKRSSEGFRVPILHDIGKPRLVTSTLEVLMVAVKLAIA
jgi:3-dehydroquinate synthase